IKVRVLVFRNQIAQKSFYFFPASFFWRRVEASPPSERWSTAPFLPPTRRSDEHSTFLCSDEEGDIFVQPELVPGKRRTAYPEQKVLMRGEKRRRGGLRKGNKPTLGKKGAPVIWDWNHNAGKKGTRTNRGGRLGG
ncbi:hypothetical protein LINGRAPRIM_LOCUS2147, partial [Linum grandiflorum]